MKDGASSASRRKNHSAQHNKTSTSTSMSMSMSHRSRRSSKHVPAPAYSSSSALHTGPFVPSWGKVSSKPSILQVKDDKKQECGAIRGVGDVDDVGDPIPVPVIYEMTDIAGGLCFQNGKATNARAKARTLLQQMGDVSTGFVIGDVFSDREAMQHYVGTFVKFVEDGTADYISANGLEDLVYLVYKGGNVLVEYFTQFLKVTGTQHNAATMIHYNKLLKRSDADFQYYFKTDDVFWSHSLKLKRLVLSSMYKFASWLVTSRQINNSLVFPLKPYQDLINEKDATLAVTEVSVHYRKDFMVLNAKKNEIDSHARAPRKNIAQSVLPLLGEKTCDLVIVPLKKIVEDPSIDANDRPYGVFITYNDSLSFGDHLNRASFHLARMKLNIDVKTDTCVFHAPAELIDVSFSNPDDHKLEFTRGRDVNLWTQVQRMWGVDVRIPTMEYLVNHDLSDILFVESQGLPWNDAKYDKRMLRYLIGSALLCTGDTDADNALSKAGRWSPYSNDITKVVKALIVQLNRMKVQSDEDVFELIVPTGRTVIPERMQVINRAIHQFSQVLENMKTVLFQVRSLNESESAGDVNVRIQKYDEMMEKVIEYLGVVKTQADQVSTVRKMQLRESLMPTPEFQSENEKHESFTRALTHARKHASSEARAIRQKRLLATGSRSQRVGPAQSRAQSGRALSTLPQ